jgi:hypothetical protein
LLIVLTSAADFYAVNFVGHARKVVQAGREAREFGVLLGIDGGDWGMADCVLSRRRAAIGRARA